MGGGGIAFHFLAIGNGGLQRLKNLSKDTRLRGHDARIWTKERQVQDS